MIVATVDILPAFEGTSSYGERSLEPSRFERMEPAVADVHIYVNRPAEKEGTALEDLKEALEKLEHVSDVDVNSPGNVVAVSFEGGRAEREEIERTIEESGYGVSRISVRTTFNDE
jgi:copper chaperone CopZ